ncbi:MAG: MFS transporter [Deltaproteobacteria bacterium]|nr:MAG: MFS transporter [Deltaproteobacteria bacterium]
MSPRAMFAVLRHPAFRWIWLGALISNTGNWMEAVAQSWLVQRQTSSPFMVELLAASEFVPHAVLMLAAGWLADHYNRRKVLLAGQSVMMVLGAVLAVAAHLGWATPWVIIAISFAEGAAWASVTPSWQAVVPALVPRSELPSAIALNSAQFNTARLLGPMIAGALLSTAGAAFVFDVNVASFVGIVAVLALIRVPEAELAAAHTSSGELAHSGGIRPAVRWAAYEPGPRRIILGIFAFALLAAPVQGLMAPMADEVLHIGAHGYGILLSCLGAGAIAGALTLARLPRSYPRHHLIPISMLAFALCALVYGASRWPLLSGAGAGDHRAAPARPPARRDGGARVRDPRGDPGELRRAGGVRRLERAGAGAGHRRHEAAAAAGAGTARRVVGGLDGGVTPGAAGGATRSRTSGGLR